MGVSFVYILALFACALLVARNPKAIRFQAALILLFSPIVLSTLMVLVLPAYWQVTIGPNEGVSDDGRGFGTALVLLMAVPTTLILNLVLYAARLTDPAIPNEVPQ